LTLVDKFKQFIPALHFDCLEEILQHHLNKLKCIIWPVCFQGSWCRNPTKSVGDTGSWQTL